MASVEKARTQPSRRVKRTSTPVSDVIVQDVVLLPTGEIRFQRKLFNSVLQCMLCKGIFCQPYTIRECLHSFCKSCLWKHFEYKEEKCPKCGVELSPRAREISHPDRTLTTLVQKLYPDVIREDWKRERAFCAERGLTYVPSEEEDRILKMEEAERRAKEKTAINAVEEKTANTVASRRKPPKERKRESSPTETSSTSTKKPRRQRKSAEPPQRSNAIDEEQGSPPRKRRRTKKEVDFDSDSEVPFNLVLDKMEPPGSTLKALSRPCIRTSARVTTKVLQLFLGKKLGLNSKTPIELCFKGEVLSQPQESMASVMRRMNHNPHQEDTATIITYRSPPPTKHPH